MEKIIKAKKPKIAHYRSYEENIKILTKQYGKVNGNYFLTDSFKSKNQKISRGKEHLHVHHIMENRAIMLGNAKYASQHPYDYQKGENLVYCNLLEHAILHMSICLHDQHPDNQKELLGFGGLFNFIVPELVDHYAGWDYKSQTWRTEENAFLKPTYLAFVVEYSSFIIQMIFKDAFVWNKNYEYIDRYIKMIYKAKGAKLDIIDFVPSQSYRAFGKQCPKEFVEKYLNIVVDIEIQVAQEIKKLLKQKKQPNQYIDIESFLK